MRQRLVLSVGALIALAVISASAFGGEPAAHAADRDCSDFSSQRQAHDYFVSLGGPSSDPDRLDGDHDGVACESLPCPCGSSAGAAPKANPTPRKTARVIQAQITSVTDGDTVRVRTFGASQSHYRVRLIGIDTPEHYGGAECGSAGASTNMRGWRSTGAATAGASC